MNVVSYKVAKKDTKLAIKIENHWLSNAHMSN